MPARNRIESKELIESISELISERTGPADREVIDEFARRYYAGTAADDLAGSETADLYGATLAHWNFARHREPGTPKIRVYNPMLEQHGWQSTHTIVEIVTDDMPFLVDSVRMALNARALTSHLVIHPVMRLRRDGEGRLVAMLEHGDESEGAEGHRPDSSSGTVRVTGARSLTGRAGRSSHTSVASTSR